VTEELYKTMHKQQDWIGVDFDSTLAHYTKWTGPTELGEPIPAMVERVKRWLSEGRRVKVFTARAWSGDENHGIAIAAIKAWCLTHVGQELEVTCEKDPFMVELFDDRATAIEPNTGKLLNKSRRGLE
jgi:hypothetical protein